MNREVYKLEVHPMFGNGRCYGCYHSFSENGVSIIFRTFKTVVEEQIPTQTNLNVVLCEFCKNKLKNELNSIV